MIIRSADFRKIRPSLRQRKFTIGAATDLLRVVLILPIVLPKTDRTNFVLSTCVESTEIATRASVPKI